MFKNLIIYQLDDSWPAAADQWEQALERELFAACKATQEKSLGWVPPRGHEHGALVESIDGQWLACFAIETRSVPADAVRRRTQEIVDDIESRTGRRPGKAETRDIRDEARTDLLPRAFPRRSHVRVWINPRQRRLMLDAGSQSKADELISSLARVAGKGFAISLLQTRIAPQAAMTEWLLARSPSEWPPNLIIERECELKGSGEEPAVIRFMRHEVATDEVRQHVDEGKLPTRLALSWQDRVRFVLTQDLQIKKIRFDDDLFQADHTADPDERFDADLALSTAELSPLIDDLINALGGLAELGSSMNPTDRQERQAMQTA